MATAKKVPVPTRYNIVLTMDEKEAQVLTDILYAIGGDPIKTDRKYAQVLYDTMRKHVVPRHGSEIFESGRREIYFKS